MAPKDRAICCSPDVENSSQRNTAIFRKIIPAVTKGITLVGLSSLKGINRLHPATGYGAIFKGARNEIFVHGSLIMLILSLQHPTELHHSGKGASTC